MFAAAGRLTGNAAIATRSAAAVLATTSVVSYGVLHQQKQTEHDKSNLNLSNASCDAVVTASTSASGVHARLDANKLRKRMTAVGRFSLLSETRENPSIPTFFVALAGHPTDRNLQGNGKSQMYSDNGGGGMSLEEFGNLWTKKDMGGRHERFVSKVDQGDEYFGPASLDVKDYIRETLPYHSYRTGLQKTIEHMLTAKLDVGRQLWEATICSSGELGSSGAISAHKVKQLLQKDATITHETVVAFRAHHAMADGVSLMSAMAELADESEDIHLAIDQEMAKRRRKARDRLKRMSVLERLVYKLRKVLGFWIWGSIKACTYHLYLLLVSSGNGNPFDAILALHDRRNRQARSGVEAEEEHDNGIHNTQDSSSSSRTVSWCDLAPVSHASQLAKILCPSSTINDLMITCVSYAVCKQLEEHDEMLLLDTNGDGDGDGDTGNGNGSSLSESEENIDLLKRPRPKYLNVAVPVHLRGGVIPRGESMGNRIGAMVARVPCPAANDDDTSASTSTSSKRLQQTSQALHYVKQTPMAFLGYGLTKVLASSRYLPSSVCQWLFRASNANATFVVSNVRGPASELHWNGRPIVATAGFVPLPPGIPIGVVVQSYNGMITLSLTADGRAVPDADKFLTWMVQEYERLFQEAARTQAQQQKQAQQAVAVAVTRAT